MGPHQLLLVDVQWNVATSCLWQVLKMISPWFPADNLGVFLFKVAQTPDDRHAPSSCIGVRKIRPRRCSWQWAPPRFQPPRWCWWCSSFDSFAKNKKKEEKETRSNYLAAFCSDPCNPDRHFCLAANIVTSGAKTCIRTSF